MKWFKHSALASLQTPIRSIKEKYGYAGLGIFWCIVEAVYLNEGQLTIGEIKRMFWNKHFTKTKIEDILMGFGCFKFDTMSRVSLSEDSPSVSPSVSPNVSPSVSPSVNARTYNREDKEKKRKEEEGKKASTSTSNSPVKVEDPDEESVKEAAGWKKISDMFHELEEADKHHPIWKENVCRNFGHGDMLVRYWATGIDMLKSHIICKGKWDLYTNRQKLLSMASCYFVGFEDTHNEVLAEITHLEQEKHQKQLNDDFMSTYFGRPLPDDAPPRPSHTADWDGGEWYEPRTLRGGKRNPNYNIYATS